MTRLRVLERRRVGAAACVVFLAAGAAQAGDLKIENVRVAPRDARTAAVTFDIAWTASWRYGIFHDAAWVFFKARTGAEAEWQHVRPAAGGALNPRGYGQAGGTPLESIVPDDRMGMFLRRAGEGQGGIDARGVTGVLELDGAGSNPTEVHAFGIEMVYVAEGPFYLGSGGTEWNRFYAWTEGSRDVEPRHMGMVGWEPHDDGQETPPYRVTGPGAIPTGRQKGRLWAAGFAPEDGGEIPAAFPNGYAAFYFMRHLISQGQYAAFLNTLTETQAEQRFHAEGQGRWIDRSGASPDYTYSASGRPPSPYAPRGASEGDPLCPWLSWADCAAFAAWAGLRPMTELEYEKAVRGPREAQPDDRWLSSYWGASEINAGLLYERPVTVGNAVGRAFAGTHGRGSPTLPEDWPADVGGAVFRGNYLHSYPLEGEHMGVSGRTEARHVNSDRNIHPFPGWRGARTAPGAAAGPVVVLLDRFRGGVPWPVTPLDGPVRVDRLPDGWGTPALTLAAVTDVFPVQRRFPSANQETPTWKGPGDASARVYLAWDGEALLAGADVTDDRHVNVKTGAEILDGDAMQVALVIGEGIHWNLALALTAGGVALHQFEGKDDALLKIADCAVMRDEPAGVTRYGLRLPLAVLGLRPGKAFGLTILFFDDDEGSGHRCWLELAPGLAGLHDVTLYPRFILAK